jgi:hypothetical protein
LFFVPKEYAEAPLLPEIRSPEGRPAVLLLKSCYRWAAGRIATVLVHS